MPIRLGRTPTKMVDCRQVRGCRSISFHSSYINGFGVRIASGFVMDYAGLSIGDLFYSRNFANDS
jgi:hypothetical protein